MSAVVRTAPAATAATPAPPARHCTLDAETGATACFATYTAAVADATDGRVLDAPADARTAVTDPAARALLDAPAGARTTLAGEYDVPSGEVVHGTFFTDPNFGGSSFTVHGDGLCDDDGSLDFKYTFPEEWWDQFSSVQAWANCSIYLYTEPDQGGERDGRFNENVADVGDFIDDRTRSTSFH